MITTKIMFETIDMGGYVMAECSEPRKSKLQQAAEAEFFTAVKMKGLGGTVNSTNNLGQRLEDIAEKIDNISDKFFTASMLLDRAVEAGDTENVSALEEQIEAITGATPADILALEKVLGLNKKAKKISKEDAAKMLGL